MTTDFEDRLERELVAAARRAAAAMHDGAPRFDDARDARASSPRIRLSAAAGRSAATRRRRPRPLPVAAVALAAIVALATAVLALPGGDASRHRAAAPTTGPIPRQCDGRAAAGELRLTDAAPPPRLLQAFAVLRRPQTGADRATCAVGMMGVVLNPSAIRYAGRDVSGGRLFLAPVAGIPDTSRRRRGDRRSPNELPVRWQAMLCYSTVSGRGSGGSCQAFAQIGRGRFLGGSYGRGVAQVLGLFTDGVAAVEIEFRDGGRRRIEVHDNVATIELRGRPGELAATAVRYRLLDADGATIVTRRDATPLRPLELLRPNAPREARTR